MSEAYRIDYDEPDVEAIVRQIRERAAAHSAADPAVPALARGTPAERLREYLLLDDETPYGLQERLGLGGAWNVVPEDLRASHPGPLGALIRSVRTLLRPATKVLVNADRPIFKQFKLNLGFAAALHDLLHENARLASRLRELEERVAQLEGGTTAQRSERDSSPTEGSGTVARAREQADGAARGASDDRSLGNA